ncbi:hypothetical protein Anas_02225 [Armadillidium nasatum]|uniref:Cytochrome P450 4C1 n=1 Tax=Armadillidium nasatum TaxID=96803 RepID=A0A5N5TFE7_9CRUS|nr:hypothetical protein Anas_02225 [Armadillidium nasatum]
MMPSYTALLSAEHFSNASPIIYTLIIIIITVWIRKLIRRHKKFSVLNSIPGPKTVFLLGNAIDFMGGPRGSLWHMRRKMLTPAFHFKILEEFIEVFNQQSQKFVNKLQKYSDGKPFNIFPLITLATLDIILETAMGRSINAQDNPQSEYVKAVYDMGRIIMVRFARPWLQLDFIFKRTQWGRLERKSLEFLHKFSLDTIRERRKEYKRLKNQKEAKENEIPGKKKRQAFLDLLIEYSEQNEFLTEENIREEVDTFMFEGHDTTAAGINWTIYLLGRYPEIQEKVYKELESIFRKSERPASYDDIREMNYLECCIKESLRLLPSVPYFSRCLTEDMIIVTRLSFTWMIIPLEISRRAASERKRKKFI